MTKKKSVGLARLFVPLTGCMGHADRFRLLDEHRMSKGLLLFSLSLTLPSLAAVADLSASTAGGWTVQVFSNSAPIGINRIQDWRIQILDAQGQPVPDAEVQVNGGMPEHDHGLPTVPQVTGYQGDGIYLLQGIRFHMPGLWQVSVHIQTSTAREAAMLEFSLPLSTSPDRD